ncbi:MAG TPA: DUF3540 domain-containing protein [Candidatus Dormibacteraeota bacterium]|nr:DUF3540 domain-containing protein [Candidatus Dormibacteraeota bacterium]
MLESLIPENANGSSPSLPSPLKNVPGYLGPAEILARNEAEPLFMVKWESAGQSCRSWASSALASPHPLQPGDLVLVISQNLADFYIIGLLSARRPGLAITHDPDSNKTRIQIPTGDLEFVTAQGSISFQAAKDIRFAGSSVSLLSRWGACLGVFGANGKVKSSLTLEPEALKLKSAQISADAGQAEFNFQNAQLSGNSAQVQVGFLRITSQRFESIAETLMEKAKNVYRTAEELSQTQAGRLRTIVRGLWQVKARKAFLKADEDFRVDGDKIHLG